MSCQSSGALGGQTGELDCTHSPRPWLGIWLWEVTVTPVRGGREGPVQEGLREAKDDNRFWLLGIAGRSWTGRNS